MINCYDTYTLIGGHTFSDGVRAVMDEADRSFAWLWELEVKVGKRICELTGAEAAFVTPGVFAALSMCAAACMAGRDREKMSRLPDTSGMRNEFIVQRALRDFKYDRAMTVAGGRLVEAGDERRGCTLRQLEDAITDRTTAFHYMAHGTTGGFASKEAAIVPISEVLNLAHGHGLPVIVDAAFQCYPREGLRRYTDMGVDAVAYSCKYFGGPNTAGILLGRKELVDTVALHSFVGQEGGPGGQLFLEAEPGRPHGSVFRGYKMDRSSIVGAVASLEEHLERDYEVVFVEARRKAEKLAGAWEKILGVKTKLYDVGSVPNEPGKISLHLELDLGEQRLKGIVRRLMEGNPSIWASSTGSELVINITTFMGLMLAEDHDTGTIMERVAEEVRRG